MHPRMKIIHDYLFKKFNKHVAFNILERVCYKRCHCMELYDKCSICHKQFYQCVNCDNSDDIVECDGKNCLKLLCSRCDKRFTYGNGKSYCTECFYMCHRCKEFAHTHVHKECGYGLCEDCYKYNTIIYNNWEICSNCKKKIRVIGSAAQHINYKYNRRSPY